MNQFNFTCKTFNNNTTKENIVEDLKAFADAFEHCTNDTFNFQGNAISFEVKKKITPIVEYHDAAYHPTN